MIHHRPDIFKHTCYRKYLRSYYELNKAQDPQFSIRYFAKRAGLRSYNYLKLVMDHERRLTEKFIAPFSKALGLSPIEHRYFEALIEFGNETDSELKTVLFDRMMVIRSEHAKGPEVLSEPRYRVYQEWYVLPVLELSDRADFKFDADWVSSVIGITVPQAKKSLEILRESGLLVEMNEAGKSGWQRAVNTLDSKDEVPQPIIQGYHSKVLTLAASRVFELGVNEREFGNITCGLSERKLKILKAKIKTFRAEVFALLDEPETGSFENIYHLNFQLYPVAGQGLTKSEKSVENVSEASQ